MYRLRIQSPLGFYPSAPLSVDDGKAKLLFNRDVAFTVVKVQHQETHGLSDEHYSEVDFLSLEEVRFLSAISMAHHPEQGIVALYPLSVHRDIDTLPRNESDLFEIAGDHLDEIQNTSWSARGMVLPGGCAYEHQEVKLDESVACALVRKAKLTDHLLMRGLGALTNAQMLSRRFEFVEAAVMMLFVALETSFQLICRILKGQGVSNPVAADASAYLEHELGFNFRDQVNGYFPQWYETRIKALHPASRFGTFAFPPLQHDDYYFLRSSMMIVFAYLISGHRWSFTG